jgi:fatty-acid desaturase
MLQCFTFIYFFTGLISNVIIFLIVVIVPTFINMISFIDIFIIIIIVTITINCYYHRNYCHDRTYDWQAEELVISFNMTGLAYPTCSRLEPPVTWLAASGTSRSCMYINMHVFIFRYSK